MPSLTLALPENLVVPCPNQSFWRWIYIEISFPSRYFTSHPPRSRAEKLFPPSEIRRNRLPTITGCIGIPEWWSLHHCYSTSQLFSRIPSAPLIRAQLHSCAEDQHSCDASLSFTSRLASLVTENASLQAFEYLSHFSIGTGLGIPGENHLSFFWIWSIQSLLSLHWKDASCECSHILISEVVIRYFYLERERLCRKGLQYTPDLSFSDTFVITRRTSTKDLPSCHLMRQPLTGSSLPFFAWAITTIVDFHYSSA